MKLDPESSSNPSSNPSFEEIIQQRLSRRAVMLGGLSSAGLSFLGCAPATQSATPTTTAHEPDHEQPLLGFEAVPISFALDQIVVPPGYQAQVLYAWGDPISSGPEFSRDASNPSAEQEKQAGMHHDGMHYFPFDHTKPSVRGLLAINHEYTDDGLLHAGGMSPWTTDKVAKSQAAHGVSVIEIAFDGKGWQVVRSSGHARRITARTPIGVSGPLAGHASMRTSADPEGVNILGTLNNCACGHTPWNTYLTCEENWSGYFVNPTGVAPGMSEAEKAAHLRNQARYGINATGAGYRWHEHDLRFDASLHPNEPNRFGWVTEIDPFDPQSKPVKRTALGRLKHEGALCLESKEQHAVVYMGDDERFEYIYKFVSAQPWRKHRGSPLDEGTLYVARFTADGTGEWIALIHGNPGLTPENDFYSQADVLLETRRAADTVGATKMDRPEWITAHPKTHELYCSLTNNNRRASTKDLATDAANPRTDNIFGHIIRWRERNDDTAALAFDWDIFVLCGNPKHVDPNKRGNIHGDTFGSPDGLHFDRSGRLWIQTDISTTTLGSGDYAPFGNNQLLAADTTTGEIRRFLTGPNGCEITGVVTTPDARTLFVNIQHPGEPASERSDPTKPKAVSSWPEGASGGRPRSATVVIRKIDGGEVGT